MKEDIAHLYKLVFNKKFVPQSAKIYRREDGYINIAITFVGRPDGQLTHYIHIYK